MSQDRRLKHIYLYCCKECLTDIKQQLKDSPLVKLKCKNICYTRSPYTSYSFKSLNDIWVIHTDDTICYKFTNTDRRNFLRGSQLSKH